MEGHTLTLGPTSTSAQITLEACGTRGRRTQSASYLFSICAASVSPTQKASRCWHPLPRHARRLHFQMMQRSDALDRIIYRQREPPLTSPKQKPVSLSSLETCIDGESPMQRIMLLLAQTLHSFIHLPQKCNLFLRQFRHDGESQTEQHCQ